MPETPSLNDLSFLLFVIPGFITVWSYRYSTYSEKKADFELLGLSFFWGIVIAAFYGYIAKDKKEAIQLFSNNPYAACLVLSFIGSIFAFAISTWKEKNHLTDAVRWLRSAKRIRPKSSAKS